MQQGSAEETKVSNPDKELQRERCCQCVTVTSISGFSAPKAVHFAYRDKTHSSNCAPLESHSCDSEGRSRQSDRDWRGCKRILTIGGPCCCRHGVIIHDSTQPRGKVEPFTVGWHLAHPGTRGCDGFQARQMLVVDVACRGRCLQQAVAAPSGSCPQ